MVSLDYRSIPAKWYPV